MNKIPSFSSSCSSALRVLILPTSERATLAFSCSCSRSSCAEVCTELFCPIDFSDTSSPKAVPSRPDSTESSCIGTSGGDSLSRASSGSPEAGGESSSGGLILVPAAVPVGSLV